jgi:DHA3 family tetracycline resistance protein-like MFS transporter
MAVFYVQELGFNPLQLVLIGTALEIAALVFEVPTGAVADSYSRKISVVIGLAIMGLFFILQAILTGFLEVALLQMLAGLGWTFISGALDAWAADELGTEKAGKLYIGSYQIGGVSVIVAIVLGTYLGTISLRLPQLVGGSLLLVLCLVLLFVMPEKGFKPAPRHERGMAGAMVNTIREGVGLARRSPVIISILAAGVIFGAFSEGFDRLWEAHFLANFTFPELWGLNPIAWFGVINVGVQLIKLVVGEIIRRKVDTNSHVSVARALILFNSLLCLGLLVFGLAGNFWIGLAAYWCAATFRGVYPPLYITWLNQKVTNSQVRATVLSIGSQADALGQLMGGPLLGLLGTLVSLNAALVASVLLLLPTIFLYTRTLKEKTAPETEAVLLEEKTG